MTTSQRLMLTLFVSVTSVSSSIAQFCAGGYSDSIDVNTVYFTNQATGSYNWIAYDYGDGVFELYVSNPVHTYPGAGIYEACQIIQDTITGFCFDFVCDTLYIGGATCMADFDYFPDGLNVEFYDYSFGVIDSIVWDFGDGTTSNVPNPIHTYSLVGTYTACLSLFDSSGSMCDSVCYPVFVDTVGCEADFDFSTNGLTADFVNQSMGNFNEVFWDFGDGFGSSQDISPSYTYFLAGTYTVCLDIYDNFGSCFDGICFDVTLTDGGGGGACDADFEYTTDQLSIECTDLSSGLILTSFWDFGDGSTPGIDPNHAYVQPGTYEVCLTVGNIFPFCFDTYCESVTVNEFTCEPSFKFTRDANNLYSFTNTTTVGNVTSVLWEFGDGNTSTFAGPSYTYNAPGSYEVCLTTYDGENACGVICQDVNVFPLGVSDIKSRSFSIYPNPSDGSFELSNASASGNLKITLYDLSGRVIANRAVSNASTMVSLNYDVPAGIYMLDLDADNGAGETFRLIITQ